MTENEADDRPRARRSENDDDRDERPRRRRDEDDYEDPGDRRARRGRRGDATGGLIPYKNAKALASYYCGVFALIPCLGAILGPIALVLGFMGLAHANKMPESKGKAHAIVGIVLGGLVILGHIAAVAMMGFGAAGR
jgi:hypothetical protein